jgi:type VI secretion system protein ImpF
MAELTPKERLQPSLLDRLADNEPSKTIESRDQRILSIEKIHDCVVRDLAWLFNSENLSSGIDLTEYPDAAASTLNYGIPSFSGRFHGQQDERQVEANLRESILRFEPRLIAESLHVRARFENSDGQPHLLSFEIEAMLWAQPVPLQLLVKAEVDLESGDFNVVSA